MSNSNLLRETLSLLAHYNLTVSDVRWVGNRNPYMTWEKFADLADNEYNSGYGAEEVQLSLKVVGDDWWLERHEYDGSEWWEFKSVPVKPEKKLLSTEEAQNAIWMGMPE